ncbi:type IX secretion system membrane protein PorP/SprF [Candidatus Dependentiae bacterium]|nr:type IX secretion system membrane protein PorP/SprF [Candidatus Dependentiae bacterium]
MKRYSVAVIFVLMMFTGIDLYAGNYGGEYGAGTKNEGHSEYFSVGKTFTENPIGFIYFNPAGIIKSEKILLSATTSRIFTEIDGLDQHELDLLIPVYGYTAGLSYSSLKVEDIREADNLILTGNMFSSKLETIRLSAGRELFDNFSFGIQSKLFKQTIYDYSNSVWSLSAGALYKYKDFIFSGTVQNLFSTEDAFISKKEKLPVNFETGVNVNLFEIFNFSAVFNIEEQKKLDYRIGLTFKPFKYFVFNAGYVNESKQPAAGISINLKKAGFYYAVSKHKELDLTHKFSVDIFLN